MKNRHPEYSARKHQDFAGDFALWLRQNAGDNSRDLQRLKRNLRLVRQAELTERQKQVLQMHFEQQMSVTDIARALSVAPSTVSRTLQRGKARLYRFLQYSL